MLRALAAAPCCVCRARVQCRFAKHVFPGETLEVSMWVTSPTTVVFQTSVVQRPGTVAITNAAVTFAPGAVLRSGVPAASPRL
jgi:acyl-CoA thioesterase FadM